MLGLVVLVLYFAIIILNLIRKKDNLAVTLVYITLGPLVKIGSLVLEPAYFVLVIYIIGLIIKKKINLSYGKSYILLAIFSLVLYCISTAICSYYNFSTVQKMLGLIKFPIFIIIFLNNYKNKNVEKYFDKFVNITLLLNVFASFSQFILKDKILDFYKLLYSDGTDYYTTISGKYCYARTFGLFQTPMIFGIICLFIFTYILYKYKKIGKLNLMQLLSCLILGIMSSSKTFIIGVPIIFLLNFIDKIKGLKKINKKTILRIMIIIFFMPVLISLFNVFVNYLTEKGMFIKYYLNFLTDPFTALSSRYSTNNDILLSNTYSVINNHPIIGVGFNSILGEFTGDSTYILALHNGGYISLISIIIFFVFEFIKNIKNNKYLFVFTWIITGFGYPTLFGVSSVIPFIYFFYFNDQKSESKEIGGK